MRLETSRIGVGKPRIVVGRVMRISIDENLAGSIPMFTRVVILVRTG